MTPITRISKAEKSGKLMKWIEAIHLRTANSNRKVLESKLQELIRSLSRNSETQSIKIYNREMVGTDINIILFQDIEKAEIGGSRLGMRLVAALKKYGIVNHSIWIEKTRQ